MDLYQRLSCKTPKQIGNEIGITLNSMQGSERVNLEFGGISRDYYVELHNSEVQGLVLQLAEHMGRMNAQREHEGTENCWLAPSEKHVIEKSIAFLEEILNKLHLKMEGAKKSIDE